MTIEDQRIHQNRKRNNQNRPTNNLIVDEYDGETLSHDKANAKTCKVHIISDLDIDLNILWYQTSKLYSRQVKMLKTLNFQPQ